MAIRLETPLRFVHHAVLLAGSINEVLRAICLNGATLVSMSQCRQAIEMGSDSGSYPEGIAVGIKRTTMYNAEQWEEIPGTRIIPCANRHDVTQRIKERGNET